MLHIQDKACIFVSTKQQNKMDSIAIKKDITNEAKQVLSRAMSGFCKPAPVKTEMQLWIEDRTMQIRIHEGLDPKEAKEKATKEWESK